ncbi:hypothetical protein K437DRAFT_252491 [Tilletiaria anomala UBC 951]|uniref:Kinetochore protein Spc24 n=1 Tax=Tilletiaria anomala (strain ATCC 24038 / CBS 436.72 / UBC 951) TaxID=1037660 RepID=A0A066V7D8_TILAU|nr:uncharacterized protein K437DRAFT_252491 [Tilletiaria anomala UBC 951]KDN36203.1 hypothetical protein K437DRAFT_252491 [Tilletiaria anomala UBC 951]
MQPHILMISESQRPPPINKMRDSTLPLGEVQDQGLALSGLQEPEDVMAMIPEIKALMKDTKELDEIREIKRLKRTIEEKRKIERSGIRKELEDLKRQLSLIASQSERGIADWRTERVHAAEMERLNTEKFALAKANAELQVAIERLEHSKVAEEERIEAMDAEDPAEGMDVDGDAIMLKILRSIGFMPLYDSSKSATLAPGGAPFEELTVISKKRQTSLLMNVSQEYLAAQDLSPIALADQLWKAVA